jgi:hypothetical protein
MSHTSRPILQIVLLAGVFLTACSGGGEGNDSTNDTGQPPIAPSGFATLRWTPPTERVDGTPLSLSDIRMYLLYYGTDSRDLGNIVSIGGGATTRWTVTGLTPGTWYFEMTAVDTQGAESARSNMASKVVR